MWYSLNNGSLGFISDQLNTVADSVDYFGNNYLGGTAGYCSDDQPAVVDASSGLLYVHPLGCEC